MEKLEHPWHTIYEELPNPLKCKLVVAEWSRQVKDNVNYCIVTSTFFCANAVQFSRWKYFEE